MRREQGMRRSQPITSDEDRTGCATRDHHRFIADLGRIAARGYLGDGPVLAAIASADNPRAAPAGTQRGRQMNYQWRLAAPPHREVADHHYRYGHAMTLHQASAVSRAPQGD
jgi:hypothetical protein